MRRVIVFRFRNRDRITGSMLLAEDFATAEAIAHMGGAIEPDSAVEVDASEISATAGLLMVKRGAA